MDLQNGALVNSGDSPGFADELQRYIRDPRHLDSEHDDRR